MHGSYLPSSKVGLRVVWLSAISVLAVVAYLPAQFLPLISDDYVQIYLARQFGPVDGWGSLWSDVLYRSRATSLLLTYWTDRIFDADFSFNISSLLIHVLNTLLVFALGTWRRIGYRISGFAAAFFAVAEGHQEAVIWYAALPELLVFTFVLLAFLCWIRFLQLGARRKRWYVLCFLCYGLALFSKESAVVLIALQALSIVVERADWRKRALQVLPFTAAGAVYFLAIYSARTNHLHFNDGTFSLSAPFVQTTAISIFRLLWFWGFLAVGFLAWRRRVDELRIVAIAFGWIVLTFGPYVFLTYMSRVPSRHTYLASVGLALLAGTAMKGMLERSRRAATVLAVLVIAHNCIYLWTYKQWQFAERAAPTERLLEFARKHPGTIETHCFPYSIYIAQFALNVKLNRPVDSVIEAQTANCTDQYHFSSGVLKASAAD